MHNPVYTLFELHESYVSVCILRCQKQYRMIRFERICPKVLVNRLAIKCTRLLNKVWILTSNCKKVLLPDQKPTGSITKWHLWKLIHEIISKSSAIVSAASVMKWGVIFPYAEQPCICCGKGICGICLHNLCCRIYYQMRQLTGYTSCHFKQNVIGSKSISTVSILDIYFPLQTNNSKWRFDVPHWHIDQLIWNAIMLNN